MKKLLKPTKWDWMLWGTALVGVISVVAANFIGYCEGRIETINEV